MQEPDRGASSPHVTRRRLVIMLLGCASVFGGVLGYQAFERAMMLERMASAPAPIQTVSTVTAGMLDWQPTLRAIGNLRAVHGTEVSAEVSGIVDEIRFESGNDVKAGQVLVNLRSGIDVGKLREAQAAVELARTDYRRNEELAARKLVSQAALDAAAAQLRSTEARLKQEQEGLQRTSVRAPFGGRIGLRVVDVGQYLGAGTKIATLQALDQLLVDFFLPQRELGRIAVGQSVAVAADAWPGETFGGEIIAVDAQVDRQTRNVTVRARVANPAHRLLPGMYVSVEVHAGTPVRHITLPQAAIVYNTFGDAVYLVQPDGDRLVARQAFVQVGPTRGDQVAILAGVVAGATVVSAGQIKLQDGTQVKVDNSVQPPSDPAPRPPDEPARRR